MARIQLWVRPGSVRDGLLWDPWRERWVVSCRAPATGGKANREVASLVAGWLDLPSGAVHWERAGSSRAKVLVAEGIHDADADRRLRAHAEGKTPERMDPR
jgi:uncharacterized protein YggU (UPF0235/DUF167 family)